MTPELSTMISQYIRAQEESGFPPTFTQSPIKTQAHTNKEVPSTSSDITQEQNQTESIRDRLAHLYYETKTCSSCHLHENRTNYVFGSGNAESHILVIGEAPGYNEDQEGLPFVGAAGQLLTKMLAAINLDRQKDLFICNVLKCRPPGNRTPSDEECMTCSPILRRQIGILEPKAILLLGKTAAKTVLNSGSTPINSLRGTVQNYNSIPTIVTYHPSALLRNNSLKRGAWEDLQLFQKTLHNEQ